MAATCDGSLSTSLSPQRSQFCPFKVPETLSICTKDTVLTAPLQNRPPRSHHALRRVGQSAECTIRCKHHLSIKTSSPQKQTRRSGQGGTIADESLNLRRQACSLELILTLKNSFTLPAPSTWHHQHTYITWYWKVIFMWHHWQFSR